MSEIFFGESGNLEHISDMTIAVIGYGNQGRAQALNLRDTGGLKVVVGQREGKKFELARQDGLDVMPISEAVACADYIQITLPDEVQGVVYEKDIKPYLKENNTLGFSCGFSVYFKQIVPPENVDVVMVSPNGPGILLRSQYEKGLGIPSLLAVHQDYTGQALQRALAYAKGIGVLRAGVIKTTLKEETVTDLFGEQAVLCGGSTALIKAAFDTLVKNGYQPEIAYFVCLHELKQLVDILYQGGISYMVDIISKTALYGQLTRGEMVMPEESRKNLEKMLRDAEDGTFAREWLAERKAGCPKLNELAEKEKKHPIEEVGKKIRASMPWINPK